MAKVDLVETIKANPGCVITVDNDAWWLTRPRSDDVLVDNHTVDRNKLHDSGLGEHFGGYGYGAAYGGDVLQALARIVGVRVESV